MEIKPKSSFGIRRRSKDGLSSWCKICDREKNLLRRRNITLKDYSIMFGKQKGLCAICKTNHNGNRSFAVDHDHTTGKKRGLLCTACNTSIGFIEKYIKNKEYRNKIDRYLEGG